MKYSTFVKLRGVGCLALLVAPIALFVVRSNANKAAAQAALARALALH